MLMYCRCSYGNVNRYQLQQNKLHNSYVNDNRYQLHQNKLHNSNNNNDNRYQLQQNKVPNFWTFVYIHIGI